MRQNVVNRVVTNESETPGCTLQSAVPGRRPWLALDHLTGKSEEIVRTLALKVRVASLSQIARTWWPQNPAGCQYAQKGLSRLVRLGVLESFRLRAHPELALEGPVLSWSPGDPPPPFSLLSYRLRTRWSEPLRVTTIYVASERSGRFYAGSGGRLSHPLQVTHDLHVSAIYLRLLKESPAEAEGWVSENLLAPLRKRQKLPDAEIVDAGGRIVRVIEFGGSYPAERVRLVHGDCERRQVPYELW